MRETVRDPQRLDHIFEATSKLIEASENIDLDNLEEKDLRYFGIVKLLEIIGEASYKLTKEFKEAHPETPWKIVTQMRHILVHGYYLINKEDVVKTVREDIPVLHEQISKYISNL